MCDANADFGNHGKIVLLLNQSLRRHADCVTIVEGKIKIKRKTSKIMVEVPVGRGVCSRTKKQNYLVYSTSFTTYDRYKRKYLLCVTGTTGNYFCIF